MADSAQIAGMPRQTGLLRLAEMLPFSIPEVWLRFLLAIVGLGLAFFAALFSTVARESGNLPATVISASLALFIAVFVGVGTVPYLARRVAAARLRDALDFEVTRVGAVYVAVVLVIGIAALNTGNNLLYIVVAAMLAAIVISGLASAANLRDLQLDIRLPEYAFAGRPLTAKVAVRNVRSSVPSLSISVVASKAEGNRKKWQWERTAFIFPPSRTAGGAWFRFPDWRLRRIGSNAAGGEIIQSPVYFPYLPPKADQMADLPMCFHRRGRYQQQGFGLTTRFPFAFLCKTRRVPLERDITVFPSVEPTDQFYDILPLVTGEFETFVRGRGDDLYRIREYVPDDSARHVDWKATAKSGSLKVREFSREDERRLRIVFDNPTPGAVSLQHYERAIALTASLGWHFCFENTELSFVAQGYSDGPDIYKFLSYLAVIEPLASPSVLEGLPPSDDYNIIITSRARDTIPAGLWACSHVVFVGNPVGNPVGAPVGHDV